MSKISNQDQQKADERQKANNESEKVTRGRLHDAGNEMGGRRDETEFERKDKLGKTETRAQKNLECKTRKGKTRQVAGDARQRANPPERHSLLATWHLGCVLGQRYVSDRLD